MKLWKNRLIALTLVSTMAALTGCGGGIQTKTPVVDNKPAVDQGIDAADVEVTLSLGHVQSDGDNVAQQYAIALKNAAAPYGIQIDIFPGGGLGDSSALVEGVQMGTVDINVTGTSEFSKLYAEMGVLDLAYIWNSYDQMSTVLDGVVGTSLADGLLDAADVRVLGYSSSFGYRSVGTVGDDNAFTNLEEVSDMSLKIRTIESAVYINSMQAMGFNPTPMGFGEVYTSLQTGVIDGYEHDANTTLENAFDEVIDNYMLTNHMCGPMGLFMSEISFTKLTAEQQSNLLLAAQEATEVHRAMASEKEAEGLAVLAESGINIIEVDVESFSEAVNVFNAEYCTEQGWTDNYNKIVG